MSTAVERLRTGKDWDSKWDLPLYPGTQNPHIYGNGYADMVVRWNGERLDTDKQLDFIEACAVSPLMPGLYYRWPGGSGGPTSHDEVMGIVALCGRIVRDKSATGEQRRRAQIILDDICLHLAKNDGDYNSHQKIDTTLGRMRYNLWRLFWFRPFVFACNPAWSINALTQLIWAGKMFWDSFKVDTSKHGPGRRLRGWLMAERMREYFICGLVVVFWKWNHERVNACLNHSLAQEPCNWPKENRVLHSLAPADWEWPA